MQIAENEKWQKGDWEYTWNANGSLKSVKLPNGNLVQYEYDALGRRTKKLANGKIKRYLWDGNVLLHEWEYNADEQPRKIINKLGEISFDKPEPINNLITWVYETGSFVPCAKITENGVFSIISDYIGRPIQVYNNVGDLVWSAEYDIYGGLRNLKGEKDFIPFRQLGQYEDVETGLYYNRFRYYSPENGLYISKDPIGLAGGLAFYAYVHDPNSWVDIFGLLGKEQLAQVQKMGAEAEILAQNKFGFTKNILSIESIIPNKFHIPDGMTASTIYEVKCVAKQGYTRQIKSYVNVANKNNMKVVLIVDNNTKLSKPLQEMIDNGNIKLERMDLKKLCKK